MNCSAALVLPLQRDNPALGVATHRITIVAALALVVVPLTLVLIEASPAGAHPLEHCFFGWTEMDGVAVNGSPEEPRHICRNEFHHHPWRNVVIGSATLAGLFTVLYALIVTPEALREEKATRRGRWRLMLRPRQMYRALPRRHWVAHWCSFVPAYFAGYVAAPPFLEWAFPPVSNLTVALYVAALGIVTLIGWRVWARKRLLGDAAAMHESSAADASPMARETGSDCFYEEV